jgi:putative transcriptional regulator
VAPIHDDLGGPAYNGVMAKSDQAPATPEQDGTSGRGAAGAAPSAEAGAPHSFAGHFLIAMPAMGDPNFARGITYLCQHSEEGAMGLVINRLSDYSLGDVLTQMRMSCEREEVAATPVLLGGPVQPERGFVLHDTGDRRWDSSYRVNAALTVTTSRDILAAMADGEGPKRALVALGYAGWGAGQLEQELRDNAWLTVEADERILFDTALEERWNAAVALVGVDPGHLASYSGRA